jgi:hypothetical protein
VLVAIHYRVREVFSTGLNSNYGKPKEILKLAAIV